MSRARGSGRATRVVVGTVLLLMVGGLFATLWVALQAGSADQLHRVATGRQALPYLAAVNRLTTDLVAARSAAAAAVAGPADPSGAAVDLTAPVARVSELDDEQGGLLRTTQRWTVLRQGIDGVVAERPTGRVALDRYGDLVTMATELADAVRLAVPADQVPGGQDLVATVVDELPALMASAGRVADLATLAPTDPTDPTGDLVALAVARHDLAAADAAVAEALLTAGESGTRPAFRSTVTAQFDHLRSATAVLAAAPTSTADGPAWVEAGRAVRERASLVATTVLGELDTTLAQRERSLRDQQAVNTGVAAAGIVLAMIVLWWSATPLAASARPAAPAVDDKQTSPAETAAVETAAVETAAVETTATETAAVETAAAEAERLALTAYLDGIDRAADQAEPHPWSRR